MHPFAAFATNSAWSNRTRHFTRPTLPDGAFTTPRGPGFFPALAQTMTHCRTADLYCRDARAAGGEGRAVLRRADFDEPAPPGQNPADADARPLGGCTALSDGELDRPDITDRKGGPVDGRTGDGVAQLFRHRIHHRGQACVQPGDAGGGVPQHLDGFLPKFDRAETAGACPR